MAVKLNLTTARSCKKVTAIFLLILIILAFNIVVDWHEIRKHLDKNSNLVDHELCLETATPMLKDNLTIHRLNARGEYGNMTGWEEFKIVNFSPKEKAEKIPSDLAFSWENTLSWTYLNFFLNILETDKSDFFVILEDDVGLDDADSFLTELSCVKSMKPLFFSFYNENRFEIDTYDFGTQLFYMKRTFMLDWIKLKLSLFRAAPIDIEISSLGLFKKTRNKYITHKGEHLLFAFY
jgi:hypothetical protein